ncbi:MAG: glycine cleavage system aminomethyltransferase GcvT [Nitrospiraceae bacterium]|nr:glycine cleavage system aminomethyltransferase GcvT [Nitrospiraceae bacterium]
MRRTPLCDVCVDTGAKIIDFHGWSLPLQFTSIIDEHLHVRRKAGLFDCSHMNEFLIEGPQAIRRFSRHVFTEIAALPVGRCRYAGILTAQGGMVDDCVVLRLDEDTLFVVTNAGPVERLTPYLGLGTAGVQDVSGKTAKLDLQGPASREVLLSLGIEAIETLRFWHAKRTKWQGTEILIARAGYTGELGYELYLPNAIAVDLWRLLTGHPLVKPCGLGARDTLRTEMSYPLYGQEITEGHTPLEAGMERFIAWLHPFDAKPAIEAQRDRGCYPVLTAIRTASRRAPRPGFALYRGGRPVGAITSGTYGPSVGHGVGLAYLSRDLSAPGNRLETGPRDLVIETASMPIYTEGSCRIRL